MEATSGIEPEYTVLQFWKRRPVLSQFNPFSPEILGKFAVSLASRPRSSRAVPTSWVAKRVANRQADRVTPTQRLQHSGATPLGSCATAPLSSKSKAGIDGCLIRNRCNIRRETPSRLDYRQAAQVRSIPKAMMPAPESTIAALCGHKSNPVPCPKQKSPIAINSEPTIRGTIRMIAPLITPRSTTAISN